MSDNKKINDSGNDNANLNDSVGREDVPTEVFETERVSFRETFAEEQVPAGATTAQRGTAPQGAAPTQAATPAPAPTHPVAPQTVATKADKPVSRKMGIASFVISIVGASVAFLALILAIVALAAGPGGHRDGGRGSFDMGSGNSSTTERGSMGSRLDSRSSGSSTENGMRDQNHTHSDGTTGSRGGRTTDDTTDGTTAQSGTDKA